MESQRVKVVNLGEGWLGTECYINGQKIKRVKAVDFHVDVEEIPTFIFETNGLPDIDVSGNIKFSFTPETVTESVKVLQNELLQHGDLYNGFLASIESSLREHNVYEPDTPDMAEAVLKRIIGEE